MSQCQVPYRRDQIDPGGGAVVGFATAVGGVGAAVEVVVVAGVAAADEAVDYDGAVGVVVTATAEQGMSQTWDWGWERGNAGWVVVVESRNRGRQHDTPRSALREHEGPEG